ncbi:DUF2993 domain-containing protein [Aminiphilus circumscriptus]|uniref:LmeA family phospholipid-binding protein n=1 Tax=Aminiphilus circumscriptus TaxID=290732 RepID=UPI000492CB77|nr:DUF2993 domain-containing protein [Aminiphilus circumscriptus]
MFRGRSRTVVMLFVLAALGLAGAAAVFAEEVSRISAAEEVRPASRILFENFLRELTPEKLTMIVDEEPDATGRIRRLYLDMQGPRIGGVRVEYMRVEALDVQCNPVEEWTRETETPIEVRSVLRAYTEAAITEKDINDDLIRKQIGEDDANWKKLSLDFSPEGLYARGYYHVKFLFSLDILIELRGKLGIREGKQIWLEEYSFKLNRVDVPDFLADRAVAQLQPILDLGRFLFPVRLDTLVMDDEKVHLAGRVLPQRFEGVVYTYGE